MRGLGICAGVWTACGWAGTLDSLQSEFWHSFEDFVQGQIEELLICSRLSRTGGVVESAPHQDAEPELAQSHLGGVRVPRVPALQHIPRERQGGDVLSGDHRQHLVLIVLKRMQRSDGDLCERKDGVATVLQANAGLFRRAHGLGHH
ncbi:hypothetical protein [Streptomyces pseudovenezuelae]|uniref:hypothetical protein n=1 Tax=Streptomyces pseudovenezuelae TaxID=67350 RepID=UPI002E2FA4B3|nr:hypothetical protein [Streptomyces pseudovenezuelae]